MSPSQSKGRPGKPKDVEQGRAKNVEMSTGGSGTTSNSGSSSSASYSGSSSYTSTAGSSSAESKPESKEKPIDEEDSDNECMASNPPLRNMLQLLALFTVLCFVIYSCALGISSIGQHSSSKGAADIKMPTLPKLPDKKAAPKANQCGHPSVGQGVAIECDQEPVKPRTKCSLRCKDSYFDSMDKESKTVTVECRMHGKQFKWLMASGTREVYDRKRHPPGCQRSKCVSGVTPCPACPPNTMQHYSCGPTGAKPWGDDSRAECQGACAQTSVHDEMTDQVRVRCEWDAMSGEVVFVPVGAWKCTKRTGIEQAMKDYGEPLKNTMGGAVASTKNWFSSMAPDPRKMMMG